jgi:hypothetical protein
VFNLIRVIDLNFNLIGEIDSYEYFQFKSSYHSIGDFEIRINRNKNYANELTLGRVIFSGNDIKKSGIILHRSISTDGEQWIIKGMQLKYILDYNLAVPPQNTDYDRKSGNAETVMRNYINNNFINPENLNRKWDELILSNNLDRGINLSWQSRLKSVAEEVEEISKVSGLGWIVYPDLTNKKFVFDCMEGKDLTVNQSHNPPVIFSPYFGTIQKQEFTESTMNFRNVAYVGGQGEGIAREIEILNDDIKGLNRKEVFIDARDIGEDSNVSLTERGNQKLNEYQEELYLESEIVPKGSFLFGQDYQVGDIVTIENRDWGLIRHSRIISMNVIEGSDGTTYEAEFGTSKPTLTSKIQNKFKQYDNELKR